jgi:hypothetical protein
MHDFIAQVTDPSHNNYQSPQQGDNASWESLRTTQIRPLVEVASTAIYEEFSPPPFNVAQGMVGLFREHYGDKYPDADFLNPSKIIDLIQQGKYIFVAILDEQGEVFGIGAISKFDYISANTEQYGRVGEFCKLIIAKRAQGQGHADILTEMRLEIAHELNLESVVSLPFGSHVKSQSSLTTRGFQPSGIALCDWLDVNGTGRRESAIFMHKILDSKIREHRRIFVPEKLHPVIDLAYKLLDLNCARELSVNVVSEAIAAQLPNYLASSRSGMETQEDKASASVRLFLHCPSTVDSAIELAKQADVTGLKHISVSLDVCNEAAYYAVEKLIASGFRFSGIQPLGKTDILTLQKVFDLPADAGIKHCANATKEMLDQILAG